MKTVLTTINAKYIHTSLALRWLYVANKDQFDISFCEFTLKEKLDNVVQDLLQTNPDIIGLSVYIWNVSELKEIATQLKKQKPELIIIIGGPEVMYEPEFFLNDWPIDYVISGEGEFVLGELLSNIEKSDTTPIAGVSTKNNISKHVAQADLEKLGTLSSPYMLDVDKEEMKNKLVYFETSRGCPYQCQYCLSSLEKGVRYFPHDFIYNNLTYLIGNGAKQLKFLDRTFNLNPKHTMGIFDFLIDNYREGLSCQFEVYADILKEETIDYLNDRLPKNYFRFEIGIQSTHEPTNIEVKRRQDFDLLSANVQRIMDGGKIDLHLDLIAGLPYETFDRFVKSFNDVFTLKAKELQLGFLKMLRGTNLRRFAEQYGYKYQHEAPYQIIENNDISNKELEQIHDAEHALEKFWNSGRFARTMNYLFDNQYKGKYFELFDEIGKFYNEHQLPHHGYQLEDLFRHLHNFLLVQGIDIFELIRTDYYHNFSRRPQGFWEITIDKKTKKRLHYQIGQDKSFLAKHGLSRQIIEKLTAIDVISDKEVQLTIFVPEMRIADEYLTIRYSIETKSEVHSL